MFNKVCCVLLFSCVFAEIGTAHKGTTTAANPEPSGSAGISSSRTDSASKSRSGIDSLLAVSESGDHLPGVAFELNAQ